MAILKKGTTVGGEPIASLNDVKEYLKTINVYTPDNLNIDNFVSRDVVYGQENQDLDVFLQPGTFELINPLHSPINVKGKVFVEVKANKDKTYVTQSLNDEDNNNYIRNKIGPRWSIWSSLNYVEKKKTAVEVINAEITTNSWTIDSEKNGTYSFTISHKKNSECIIPFAINNKNESMNIPFKILNENDIKIYTSTPYEGKFYGLALYKQTGSNVFNKQLTESQWLYNEETKMYYLKIEHNLSSRNVMLKVTSSDDKTSYLIPYEILDQNIVNIYSDKRIGGNLFLIAL